jgi:hypothetical protein
LISTGTLKVPPSLTSEISCLPEKPLADEVAGGCCDGSTLSLGHGSEFLATFTPVMAPS